MTIVRSPLRSQLRSPVYSPLSGAYSGGGDIYRANVSLLLGLEGANNATSSLDESPTPKTMTFAGNAKLSTTVTPPFGTSSALFDGSGDTITTPNHSSLLFGASPFTIEMFVRFARASPTDEAFCGVWGISTAASWYFSLSGGNLRFRFFDGTSNQDTLVAWAPTSGTWYHLVVDRDASNKFRIYRGGSMVASQTYAQSMNAGSGLFGMGLIPDFPGVADFSGNMKELRITKGVARVANDAGYTVPTAPYPRS